ncbi:XdhC family protein [Prosthecodimorpha staleyi]|uniref:XdhC family protein n=1 Tax=Prosthecodimorpha staleyi TaxID=2840188 RepID=A0A947D7U4_9HYPH|nr:XdhC family protein [Prosthecodimorpha staleyi]MBT9291983.1 XdhC family protein [Prosthecodimorpha staleyi]
MLAWRALDQAIVRSGRAALVTVLASRGSTPREAGARMVVEPGGTFTGTIGGGALELKLIEAAVTALAEADAAELPPSLLPLRGEKGKEPGISGLKSDEASVSPPPFSPQGGRRWPKAG